MEIEQIDKLETDFCLNRKSKEDAVYSISLLKLTEKEEADFFANYYSKILKASDLSPAGTYFSSWIRQLAMALQYSISVLNKSLDLSLSRLTFQIYPREGGKIAYSCAFNIDDYVMEKAPEDVQERKAWLSKTFAQFYGKTVLPLFQSISEAAQIDIRQLWGQLPTGMERLYDQWMNTIEDEAIRTRIVEDYLFLRKELPGEIFGLKRNPLDVSFRMIEHYKPDEPPLRMKHACCLYYKTEGAKFCYTCPRMKETERAQRREEYLKAISAK